MYHEAEDLICPYKGSRKHIFFEEIHISVLHYGKVKSMEIENGSHVITDLTHVAQCNLQHVRAHDLRF